MFLTDLADAARKSGLRVVECPGWERRSTNPAGMAGRPQSIVVHHTATSDRAPGNYPSLRIVRDGRPDLDGPLAQLGLGRDGTVYVIAAGKASHAGKTRLLRQSNSHAIGIECEASGLGEIKGAQLDAYVRLCRALADHYGIPHSNVESHAEVAVPRGRKTDVKNSMAAFRAAVGGVGPVPRSLAVAPRTRGPFPLAAGHWYGEDDGTALSHSGARERDREAVRQIQSVVGVGVDGGFGAQTAAAVKRWQTRRDMVADGKVGRLSWAAMGAGS